MTIIDDPFRTLSATALSRVTGGESKTPTPTTTTITVSEWFQVMGKCRDTVREAIAAGAYVNKASKIAVEPDFPIRCADEYLGRLERGEQLE